jgi:hypothetical protein
LLLNVRRAARLLAIALAGAAWSTASAQIRPALVIGGAGPVGFLWEAGGVAVRPDLSFNTTTSTGFAGGTTVSVQFTIGLSAILYLREWDGLRAYGMGRLAYGRTNNVTPPAKLYTADLGFGTQYALTKRFAIFGEVGPRFFEVDQGALSATTNPTKSQTWSINHRLGLLFYLR